VVSHFVTCSDAQPLSTANSSTRELLHRRLNGVYYMLRTTVDTIVRIDVLCISYGSSSRNPLAES
jgi:hypothetical protein